MSAGYSSSEESDFGCEISGSKRGGGRRPICRNKNAIVARENRLKKKAYVESLEKRVKLLKCDSKKLRSILDTQADYINELHSEIRYLKAALANAPQIGSLIRRLGSSVDSDIVAVRPKDVPPRPISPIESPTACLGRFPFSPLDVDFLENEDVYRLDDVDVLSPPSEEPPRHDSFSDHSYSVFRGSANETFGDPGVCLHVSGKKMSLEFCSKCNESAINNWKDHERDARLSTS